MPVATAALFAYKTADENRAGTTLTDDADLVLTGLQANTVYEIIQVVQMYRGYSFSSVWEGALTFTGTITSLWGELWFRWVDGKNTQKFAGPQLANGAFPTWQSVNDTGGNDPTNTRGLQRAKYILEVGASGGDLKLQWRKNIANGDNAYLYKGSFLLARPLCSS